MQRRKQENLPVMRSWSDGLTDEVLQLTMDQGNDEESSQPPGLIILFVGVCLVLGLACRHLLKGSKVPYTVALLVLGIGLGAAEYGTRGMLGALGDSIRLSSSISPSLILLIFLPALLFESSFAMEVHQIKRCLMQMVLLAGPGVIISTFCTGTLVHYVFPYQWRWRISLLLGGLLSATDPVAVVALLKELGASVKLNTLIEGESLMNDGTAIVVFRLFLELVLGQNFNAATVLAYLARVALGGIGLGIAFGLIAALWLGLVFNDTVIEITLTLVASYLAYYTAEDQAQVSGVLAVMALGIFLGAFARAAFKGETQQSMHYFWEMVAYFANTLIFILSGVVIAEYILKSHDRIGGHDWGYLVLLYIFLQLSRVIVVLTLLPGLRYFGYGLTWKEAVILTWAGLRGAVALSLSLSVNAMDAVDSSGNPVFSQKTRARFVFLTGGVVFLTLTLNGSTTQFLLQLLNMQKTSDIKLRILEYTKHEMNTKALQAFEELEEDEELGPADWQTVAQYISCLATPEHSNHPHAGADTVSEVHDSHLQDTRVRLLNGVQAAYWTMLEERRVTRTAALILMQSVDEALDAVMKKKILADWKGLDPHVQFPSYLKYIWLRNSRIVPRKLLNILVTKRLELGCYLSAAFLRAHRSARRQLRDFIGESHVAEIVIRESEAEEAAARTFLEDVRLTFPEVLRAVKTKQVTHAILNHLDDYVSELEKVGLLEEKETDHLQSVVQADLKKLLRNFPLVRMPTPTEILRGHPFLSAQPADIQEGLIASAKEALKLRDSFLYTEDARAEGIYLVANGVVQWSNGASAGKHLLHTTFSHGSTLGLYEALTGKPYLCDMRADSVVHCFFIEASQVSWALRTKPEVEELFWKESLLAIAKMLLPDYFEEIGMHELRALIMETTVLRTYLRGELIDIRPGEVSFLLEGFLKQDSKDDIIVAPLVLTKTIGGRDALYHVETRSRVAIVDLSTLHPRLRRASTSRLSSALLLASGSSFEHEGLMRWPDTRRPSEPHMRNNQAGRILPELFETFTQTTRRVSRLSRSWIESSRHEASDHLNINYHRPTGSPRKRHVSAGVLPLPQSRGGATAQGKAPNVPSCADQKKEYGNSSSDEEEHIVRIDSPSSLFQNHVSQ